MLFCLRRQHTSNSIATTEILLTPRPQGRTLRLSTGRLSQPLCETSIVNDTTSVVKNRLRRIRLMSVVSDWPRGPWFPLFRRVEERQFRVDGSVYILEDGKLRTAPRWATVVAVVDCTHY